MTTRRDERAFGERHQHRPDPGIAWRADRDQCEDAEIVQLPTMCGSGRVTYSCPFGPASADQRYHNRPIEIIRFYNENNTCLASGGRSTGERLRRFGTYAGELEAPRNKAAGPAAAGRYPRCAPANRTAHRGPSRNPRQDRQRLRPHRSSGRHGGE